MISERLRPLSCLAAMLTLALALAPAGRGGAASPLPDEAVGVFFATPPAVAGSFLEGGQYARLADHTRLYPRPDPRLRPRRNVGAGFLMSTVKGPMEGAGKLWYEVNLGEYAPAEQVQLVEPTRFRGITLLSPPPRPFAWILEGVKPSPQPGAAPAAGVALLQRYELVEILETAATAGGEPWYRIGPGSWIPRTAARRVDADPRPRGVRPGDFWVEIDLSEQTLVAYEGDRTVFASLVSSGLDRWPTRKGLFEVRQRRLQGKMSGRAGTSDYYFVEDVPYAMFFDGGIALHGAYWHDRFGNKVSHGCVNLPPRDAEWIYLWSGRAPGRLRVWVHESAARRAGERLAG